MNEWDERGKPFDKLLIEVADVKEEELSVLATMCKHDALLKHLLENTEECLGVLG